MFLHTDAFTHRHVYTQKLLQQEACTHRRLRRFHTQRLLHTKVFTHSSLYTQKLLHTDAFTHRDFYTPSFNTLMQYGVTWRIRPIHKRGIQLATGWKMLKMWVPTVWISLPPSGAALWWIGLPRSIQGNVKKRLSMVLRGIVESIMVNKRCCVWKKIWPISGNRASQPAFGKRHIYIYI